MSAFDVASFFILAGLLLQAGGWVGIAFYIRAIAKHEEQRGREREIRHKARMESLDKLIRET